MKRKESGFAIPVAQKRKRVVRHRKREWILEQPDLGFVEDRVIAKRLGVSQSWVYQARKFAGIPPVKKSDRYRQLVLSQPDLGDKPDMEIALRIGVSETTVWKYRDEAGIEASQPWLSYPLGN